ncbi:hypothetical protein Glove_22g127 [Diversispora epigaea]|uniref:Cytochrome P450 n=1 Tax=Diversispora epigaea TaxID=1348612 RepID=A0A397JVV1_9GLOM|nr:hypothetical protein Glove_22g127 [Diversispora epigaea]
MGIVNFLYEILKILLVALMAYVSYFYYKYFTRENPLPGPFPLPFIGNIYQVFRNSSLDMRKLQIKYGDLCEFYMESQRFILLGHDDLVQIVLKPNANGSFHNRVNDDTEGLIEVGILNTGLLFNNVFHDWQYHRKFFTKVMMSPSFIKQSMMVIRNVFLEMDKYWEKLGEDKVIEFNHWMKLYYFDTIFFTTTSKPANSLENYYNKLTSNEKLSSSKIIINESDLFVESVDAFVFSFVYFFFLPKIFRNFPGISKYTQYLKERICWLRNNVDNIIKTRREEISKTPMDQELKSDLLTMFLTVNTERDITERIADDLHDEPMPDKNIEANFMEVMAGGIDTGANSMCFLVNQLENNTKVKQRMIEEIELVLGKDPYSLFTLEDLSKLKYVDAVIKEASRICSVGPTIFKKNSLPEVVGGYKWSKNTHFVLNIDGAQNHKSYWKNPNLFNPDRFMDKDNPENKNQVYMWGGGLRKCPGKNLAIMELKVTLVMLYRTYDIELMKPMKERITAVRSCEELKIKLRKRKNL